MGQGREEAGLAALFSEGLAGLDLRMATEQQRLIIRYAEELLHWNRRINLVARKTSARELVEKHFLDSLTLLSVLDPALTRGETRLLDIGTGAGFPGLVLAVARPELEVILVEPRAKRVSFLRHIIRVLGLDNVRVLASRIEEATLPVQPTHVTSRALAAPVEFFHLTEEFLAKGARVILMLSPAQEEQLGYHLPGFMRVMEQHRFRLPWSGAGRVLWLAGQEEVKEM